MADFFTRLSARTLGLAPIASPRRPSPYAAGPDLPDLHLEVPASSGVSDAVFPAATEIAMAPRPDRREPPPAAPRATAEAADPAHPLVPSATRPADARRADSPVPAEPHDTAESVAVRYQPLVANRPAAPAVTAERAPGPVPNRPGAETRPRTSLPPPSSAAPAPRPRAEARSLRREPPQRAAEHAPTIAVTIGRVEVRAVTPPAPARPAPPRSALRSLDDYLKPQRRN